MTTKFEADVAAAYKAVDERLELICTVARRLLKSMDDQIIWIDGRPFVYVTPELGHVMAELHRVLK